MCVRFEFGQLEFAVGELQVLWIVQLDEQLEEKPRTASVLFDKDVVYFVHVGEQYAGDDVVFVFARVEGDIQVGFFESGKGAEQVVVEFCPAVGSGDYNEGLCYLLSVLARYFGEGAFVHLVVDELFYQGSENGVDIFGV